MLDIWQEPMGPHMLKVHIPGLGVVHKFTAEDWGDFHDHPWPFYTTILKGSYIEEVLHADGTTTRIQHNRFDSFRIDANHRHRVMGLPDGECWTCIDALWQEDTQPVHFYRFMDGAMHRRSRDQQEWVRIC